MDHFEIASALRGVVSNLHKRLRKQAYSADSLSLTETAVLSYLFRERSLSPSELADIAKVKKQSMSQVLSHLEELKLIRRVISKTDKRKMMISLTPVGQKMVEKTRYERDEWLAEAIRKRLGEKELKALAGVIPLLQQIADAE